MKRKNFYLLVKGGNNRKRKFFPCFKCGNLCSGKRIRKHYYGCGGKGKRAKEIKENKVEWIPMLKK